MIPSIFLSNFVLVLHGPSCSGKTTISQILHKKYIQSKLISIDDYAWRLWIKLAIEQKIIFYQTPILDKYRIISEQFFKIVPYLADSIPEAMRQLYSDCRRMAYQENVIILDTVFYVLSYDEIDFFWQQMSELNVFITLIYSSPFKMVQHLIQRNSNINNRFEYRRGLNVLMQFCKMYTPAINKQGLVLLTQAEVMSALQLLKSYLLQSNEESIMIIEKIAALEKQFFIQFFSDNQESVYLTTTMPYHFFLNTENLNVAESAQLIYQQCLEIKPNF